MPQEKEEETINLKIDSYPRNNVNLRIGDYPKKNTGTPLFTILNAIAALLDWKTNKDKNRNKKT